MKKIILIFVLSINFCFVYCSSSDDSPDERVEEINEEIADEELIIDSPIEEPVIQQPPVEITDCSTLSSLVTDFSGSTPTTITGEECEQYKAAINAFIESGCPASGSSELTDALQELGDCR